MMRWIGLIASLALLVGGMVLTQTRPVEAPVAPTALLYLVADTERELTRLPMHYTRIPDAEEIKIGDGIAKFIDESHPDEENRLIERYIQSVGNRVAAHAFRKLPYKFHYIPDRGFINAFALPGGHVYMGAGLLDLMENEDELAGVLGHEIEHIDRYHCAERLQWERAMRKIPLLQLASLPVEIFEAGYTKDQELEADREGVNLAVLAGYSPEGAIQVFAEFQKLEEEMHRGAGKKTTPEGEISSATIQILTGYFRSHPPSADRIAKIRDLIAEKKWTTGETKPLEVRYIFLGHQANAHVVAQKYDQAVAAATSALKLHAGYPPALAALAKARCAQHDFTAASAAYRELLPADPAAADSVRAFAGDLGAKAMVAKKFTQAEQFAAFSLELQPNNPNALKSLAQVKLELAQMDAALEAGRKLLKLYPQTEVDLNDYANTVSDQAFQAHDYERAVRFASFALQLEPNPQPGIRARLARSEFALGHFSAAAGSHRMLIEYEIREKTTVDPVNVRNYAEALGSLPGHAEAAQEFQRLLKLLNVDKATDSLTVQARIEAAGLLVMAGDESQARELADRPFTASAQSFAPEFLARLGWWYYRAGKFDAADALLHRFLTLRPGDPGLQSVLGWVDLEKNAPADALRLFKNISDDSSPANVAIAGRAIANWRLHQNDFAMSQLDELSALGPQWTNPAWVRALYGPVAAQSLLEMHAEKERRLAAARARR